MNRKPYPSDVSDDEWAFVVPYLALMVEAAPQREHPLREVFNGARYIVRTGAPWHPAGGRQAAHHQVRIRAAATALGRGAQLRLDDPFSASGSRLRAVAQHPRWPAFLVLRGRPARALYSPDGPICITGSSPHHRACLPGDMQPHHEHAAQRYDERADNPVCAELGRCLPQCRNKSIGGMSIGAAWCVPWSPGSTSIANAGRRPLQSQRAGDLTMAERRCACRHVRCDRRSRIADSIDDASAAGHYMAARCHQRWATADHAEPHALAWQQVSGGGGIGRRWNDDRQRHLVQRSCTTST